MLRIAGRSIDGFAKAISTTRDGEIRVNNKETLFAEPLTVGAGANQQFFLNISHAELEVIVRPMQPHKYRVVLDQYIKLDKSNVFISTITLLPSDTADTRTSLIKPLGNYVRIRIFNESEYEQTYNAISVMDIASPSQVTNATGQTQSPMIAKDMNGQDVSLNAEVDAEGKTALRIVDAAPWGYDNGKDAIRVISDKKNNHLLHKASNVTVTAGGYVDFEGYYDISDFLNTITTVKWASKIDFDITLVYSMEGSSYAQEDKQSFTNVIFGTAKFEVKTGTLRYVRITNKSDSDVVLQGIEIRGLKG